MLQEHKNLAGFYLCKGSSRIYASRDGDFWDDVLKDFVKVRIHDYYGYPFVDALGDKYDGHLAHIKMAELFVHNDQPEVKDIVNHKNGITADYRPENLEWVTRSENANHAYRTGLRADNKYVLLKDLQTDEVYGFYSLNRAAAFLKVNPSRMSHYLNKPQTAPFMNRYDLIWKGDKWRGFKPEDIGLVRHGLPKPVVGVRESDGSAFVFNSISAAVEYTGLSKSVIEKLIYRSSVPKLRNSGVQAKNYGWRFCLVKDFKSTLEAAVRVEKSIPNGREVVRKPYPVEVTDLSTGEKVVWPSIAVIAQSLSMKRNTLTKILSQTGGVFQGKHYKYMFNKVPSSSNG